LTAPSIFPYSDLIEGAAAFSLFCNVLQVLQTSKKIYTTTREIRLSSNGTTREHDDLCLIYNLLKEDMKTIQTQKQDSSLMEMTSRCKDLTDEHLAILEIIRLQKGGNVFAAVYCAVKARYKKREFEELHSKIDRLSQEIARHVTTNGISTIDTKLGHIAWRQSTFNEGITKNLSLMRNQLQRVNSMAHENLMQTNTTRESIKKLEDWLKKSEYLQSKKQCMNALYFREIERREGDVVESHQKTFEWIFDDTAERKNAPHEPKFRRWFFNRCSRECFLGIGKAGRRKEYTNEVSRPEHKTQGKSPVLGKRPTATNRQVLLLGTRIEASEINGKAH
jgi:hypothetical protein